MMLAGCSADQGGLADVGGASNITVVPAGKVELEVATPVERSVARIQQRLMDFPDRFAVDLEGIPADQVDDAINLRSIQTLVRKLGCDPLTAKNGRGAVEVTRTQNPDCILMGLQMPEMDGIEATDAIRGWEKSFHNGDQPVFISALTANVFPADWQRCFDVGMNARVVATGG